MAYRIYILLIFFFLFTSLKIAFAQNTKIDSQNLKEVIIDQEIEGDFNNLKQVDGMKITVGKKTEVIEVDKIVVNKATNNTRQIFAKVSGLNIFENDGSGLQLSIGGRGLDPNRTANFNVRQNGYDISADALGYPESYYTPPAQSLKRIELIKGAASLQFGTQFGGLLNFVMKQPGGDKKFNLESNQTIGSWKYFSTHNLAYGTIGKIDYLGYIQYKRGNGWRNNSQFNALNAYLDIHYAINPKHDVGIEYTFLNYLAQQAGGLDDKMFAEDPRQSLRSRNWFAVHWNLIDFEWSYKLSNNTKIDTRFDMLFAKRNAIGFRPNRPSQVDLGGYRDLLKGTFKNMTLESRLLHHFNLFNKRQTLLTGIRLYNGYATSLQANVDNGSDADFVYDVSQDELLANYEFPNQNIALFLEQIFRVNDKFSLSPGVRFEYIHTTAHGNYFERVKDLRDSLVAEKEIVENRELPRHFVLFALGAAYRFNDDYNFYANISQNYRSVTFSDIRISNPSFQISPDISDEKGWSADIGFRGNYLNLFKFDINTFVLNYNNRIGEYFKVVDNSRVVRERNNVGAARIVGIESLIEADLLKIFYKNQSKYRLAPYSNLAITHSRYTKSQLPNVVGNNLEYVPLINWRSGIVFGYKALKCTYQFSYISQQFTDATNAIEGGYSAVNGIVPSYSLMDLTLGYSWHKFNIEGTVNNLSNTKYFTRRAVGYPGPGIIPGDGRSFFITLGIKI